MTDIFREEVDDHPRIEINLFNVIYNVPIKNVQGRYQKESDLLIQEMKRNIYYKRMARIDNNIPGRIISDQRINEHIQIFFTKMYGYRKQMNRSCDLLLKIRDYFTEHDGDVD